MNNPFDAQSKRGLLWHRWDPHIHTPGTALNDQYNGSDPWESFLGAVETSSPPIRALGITDYFGIERYEEVVNAQREGRLRNVGLIFPNVELRLGIETAKASAINIHLLFSPHDNDHVERIKRFLLEFEFPYLGESYRCLDADLIRLGRAHKPGLIDDDAARSEGANQFKVNFDQLKQVWSKNEWVKKNTLIAVAGGEKDGTSGLRDATASFAAQRKNVEGLAHIVFSANPKQIRFWLGKDAASVEELESQYNGCKAELQWASGEKTGNGLTQTDMEEFLASPYVQYLSQQFVDQLCSAEGLNDALVAEIERVIFNAHALGDRQGADSFKELLDARLEDSRLKRARQQHTLTKVSADLTEERVKKDGLKALEKDRDDRKRAIEKDKSDRKSLIAKGNEERAKRHEQVSIAVDAKRLLVDQAKRRQQALVHLQNDVNDFRTRQAPALLAELQEVREAAGLSATDWDAFKVDYVGAVDTLLAERIKQAGQAVASLQGPSKADPSVEANADPTIPLIPADMNLADQTLSLLERELARLRALVGVDQPHRLQSASIHHFSLARQRGQGLDAAEVDAVRPRWYPS